MTGLLITRSHNGTAPYIVVQSVQKLKYLEAGEVCLLLDVGYRKVLVNDFVCVLCNGEIGHMYGGYLDEV
jgi:hypothetical protein